MKKKLIAFVSSVLLVWQCFSQGTPTTQMLSNTLGGVVTVAVYQTDIALRPLGYRGSSIETAYSKALDLSGAKGSGSGFIIMYDNKYYVVTNAHVIESALDRSGSLYVYTVNHEKYEARLVGGDSFYDIAVLEFIDTPGSEINALEFRNTKVDIGEQVFAIGNPLGDYPYTVTEGIISAKNRVRGGLTGKFGFLQTTATVIWGNSGGPLVDANGKVVGINSQIAFAERSGQSIWQPQINFALEAELSQRLVKDILTNEGRIKRAFLGVEISSQKLSSYFKKDALAAGETINPAPAISAVLPNGPSSSVLSPYIGYSIQQINSEEIRNIEEVLGALEKVHPSNEVTLHLSKNKDTVLLKIQSKTSSAASMANIANFQIQRWGGKLTQYDDGLILAIADRQTYSTYHKRVPELISYLTKDKPVPQNVLFNKEWLVVAAGIHSKEGSKLWRTKDIADLGAALRLTGTLGIIDLVLFRKGADPSIEENYIQKRFVLSGTGAFYKQTLWY